jgi:hypothetical protein
MLLNNTSWLEVEDRAYDTKSTWICFTKFNDGNSPLLDFLRVEYKKD